MRLYTAGKNGPYCWAAMEYIEGLSLTRGDFIAFVQIKSLKSDIDTGDHMRGTY